MVELSNWRCLVVVGGGLFVNYRSVGAVVVGGRLRSFSVMHMVFIVLRCWWSL